MLGLRLPVLLLMMGSLAAHAAEEWDFAAPQKNRCSVGTMLDMNRCLQEEQKKTDTRLNELYQTLLKLLQDPSSIRKAQAAWIRFRDLDCEYSLSGIEKDGSLRPFAANACLIDHAEKRIRDLQRYIDWNGGGGSPPFKQ